MTTKAIDRLLQSVLVLTLLACVPGVGLGFWMVGADLSESGEFLDGIGVLFGAVVLAAVVLPGGLATVALVRSRRERADADWWALAAAVAGLGSAAMFTVNDSAMAPVLVVPLLLGVISLAVAFGRRSG